MSAERAPVGAGGDRTDPRASRLRPGSWSAATWTLLALLLGGALLRAALMVGVQPITYGLYDSGTYLAGASNWNPAGGLFADVHHPVGYSVWLKLVSSVTDSGTVVAILQHLLGMLSGVLLWAALRRLGAPIVIAAIGAAAVLLNFEVVQLEHSLMSEALYLPVLVGAFAAGTWSATTCGKPAVAYALVAGALAAVAYTARYPGLVWVPVVATLPMLLQLRWRWRRGIGLAAVVLLGSALVIVPYGIAQSKAIKGIGFELLPGQGWNAYAGIARFADCTKFRVPAGTRKLCERTPPDKRPPVEFYSWDSASPAFKVEPRGFPYSDALFARFAAAATPSVDRAKGESMAPYARLWRLVDSAVAYLGPSPALGPVTGVNRPIEENERRIAAPILDLAPIRIGAPAFKFDTAKQVFRVSGGLLLIGLLITFFGLWFARRYRMAALGCWAFVGANWVVAGDYNSRYAVPIAVVGVIATCLVLTGLVQARADRERRQSVIPAGGGGW